jgi:dipeptidyl aminopeptidase/acylaminoacyl peptidase
MKNLFSALVILIIMLLNTALYAQEPGNNALQNSLDNYFERLGHDVDVLKKKIDDILWFERVGDIAFIDKVRIAGAPPAGAEKAKRFIDKNPIKFWSYVFIPKDIDRDKKYPLIVLPHGGVHGDFTTNHVHIIREMMAQQYIVVAPEYRGSTGYGRRFYRWIDYGGLENLDVKISRDYMVENYTIVDEKRVGIVGWSHGGMIALMNIFEYPKAYACAYAGVPVSDLIARMGYMWPAYEENFSANYHIGEPVWRNIDEYRKRSPVNHVHKLQTPLMITTNTNDEDVHVLEVENLINALKANDKSFEYKIYQDVPGGHSFDRMDHAEGRQARFQMYRFLEKHLNPPIRFRNIRDMEEAAYRFH